MSNNQKKKLTDLMLDCIKDLDEETISYFLDDNNPSPHLKAVQENKLKEWFILNYKDLESLKLDVFSFVLDECVSWKDVFNTLRNK